MYKTIHEIQVTAKELKRISEERAKATQKMITALDTAICAINSILSK